MKIMEWGRSYTIFTEVFMEIIKVHLQIKLPTSVWSSKKQESSRKGMYFCFIDYAKAFDCVDHNKLENSSRDGNTISFSNTWKWKMKVKSLSCVWLFVIP